MSADPHKPLRPEPETGPPPAPAPKPPPLAGAIVLRADADDLIDAALSDLYLHALNCVRAFGDFHLALAPGEALSALYLRLMYDPSYRELPWARTHLWLVHDARMDDDKGPPGLALLKEIIIDHAGIPRSQAHAIPMRESDPSRAYERELRETLGWREKGHDRLDYVLLSATDAEALADLTAPEETLITERAPGVCMTRRFVEASRLIAVFAAGADAARTLESISRVRGRELAPLGGELRWYLDHEACAAD